MHSKKILNTDKNKLTKNLQKNQYQINLGTHIKQKAQI